MARFLTSLRTEESDTDFEVRLLEPLSLELGPAGSGVVITVPAGFATDYASVPRALWWLFPPHGRYKRAAVVHDYLYSCGCIHRAIADAVFLAAMEVLRVGRASRWTMYLAVRAFGWMLRRRSMNHEHTIEPELKPE